MKPETFRRITYTLKYMSPFCDERDKRWKTTVAFHADGKLTIMKYGNNFRKPLSVEIREIDKEIFRNFASEAAAGLDKFDEFDMFVDDCCGTVTIGFDGGYIKVDRGFGNHEDCMGSIAGKYLILALGESYEKIF